MTETKKRKESRPETAYLQSIPAVPADPIPYRNVVAIENKSPSTENETPKEVNMENSRRNSCLYLDVCVKRGERVY